MNRLALIMLALCIPGSAPAAEPFAFFEPVRPPRAVQVMAHRGLAGIAPENSMAAYELAIADQLEWVEIDVRLSKDGRHVIFHDSQLDGKSDGKGALSDMTLAQLKALDVGSWFAPRFRGQRMLTLAETLALAKGRINLYLDCKQIDPELLAREIQDAGMERQVVVFDKLEQLKRVRKASKGAVAIMPKWRPGKTTIAEFVAQVLPAAVEIDSDQVTGAIVSEFHKLGVKVQAKTLGAAWDRVENWDKLLAAHVDWFQTDLPEEVIVHTIRARMNKKPVMISFHRGANRYAPENTLPAYAKAIRLGADYVEFDTRTTRDHKVFLLHDSTLNRTTNGSGPIRERTAAEVAALDAGSKFGKPFRDVHPPTFDQLLQTVAGKVNLYVDSKDIAPERLVADLAKYKFVDHSAVYGARQFLAKVKKLDSTIRVMPSLSRASDLDALVDELHPYAVDAKWGILSKELISRCHAWDVKVFSDALGSHEKIEDYRQAMEWGIDVIQTNQPLRVWRAIELQIQK